MKVANIITGSRIIFTILLLFTIPFSLEFFILYFICGYTDRLDGIVARKTNTTSQIGARLDSLADILFFIVCLIKILPPLTIPMWAWMWFGIILLIKIINLIYSYFYLNRIQLLHTKANKITGFVLFLIPFLIPFIDFTYCALLAGIFATGSSLQETYIIKHKKFSENNISFKIYTYLI